MGEGGGGGGVDKLSVQCQQTSQQDMKCRAWGGGLLIWDMKEEGLSPGDRIIGVSHNQCGPSLSLMMGEGRDTGGVEQQGPLRMIRA